MLRYVAFCGTLRRTIPGYVKPGPRTIELRASEAYSVERLRRLLGRLQAEPALSVLEGYAVRYGPTVLGPWRAAT